MVCQAASQTRFRALKHENGIAGKPTIVVRVIACFQPLQDCQVIVFGWMVKANDFWHFTQPSTWQSPNFNCMNPSLEPRRPESLPACINSGSYMFSANMGLPGFVVPGFPSLKAEQTNEAHGVHHCLPPCFQTLFPATNPYLHDKQSPCIYGFSGQAMPTAMPVSSQKRLLIFDQSGNQTRLVSNSAYPPAQNPPTAITNLVQKELAVKTEQLIPVKPVLHDSGENHLSGEEREMHEDTEEINALLYSDEDDYSDDDSVTSTDHSPFAIKGSYDEQKLVEEMTEEVASSDGPNKRQKLLDGGYNKSSQRDTATASSVKVEASHKYDDDDAESSYANGQNQGGEVGSVLGKKQSRKDKIRSTLRMLESIIPGATGMDPLVVLDEAIGYLKSLKLKAKTLGVNYY